MERVDKEQESVLNRIACTLTEQYGKSAFGNHQNSMHLCGFLL